MNLVSKIEKKMGNGCTEPVLGIIELESSSVLAVIKTKDNAQGVLAIVNEFICYHLAIATGLNMPASGIAHIGQECNFPEQLISDSSYGNCFYSVYIKSMILNVGVLSSITNKDIFEEIIIFDHITYNSDRNIGNLLLTSNKGDKMLFAIDHTHVFKNQTIWDGSSLIIGMREEDYLDTRIMEENRAVYDLFFQSKTIEKDKLIQRASRYKEIITMELLTDIVNKIPSDWKVAKADLEALKEYLLYRVAHLDEICEMIIDYRNGGEIL